MELSAHPHFRTASALAAGLIGLGALVATPATASASRLPADPMTYVGTPVLLAQRVIDSQAANVWAALADLHSE